MKRTPPLAREHAKAARAGYAPAQGIMVFDGWGWKRYFDALHAEYPGAWRALVPDDADPSDFDWTWTAGMPVLIIAWLKAKRLEALGAALGSGDITLLIPMQHGPILLPWRSNLSVE